jgi:hypothetical protein
MYKDKILECGMNLDLAEREPFSFQYGYHYYEPKIYSMNCYFEGFNLRQLKKMMFIYNQTALAYQSYLKLLDNKTRRNEPISDKEKKVLNSFNDVYDIILKVVDKMRMFINTSEPRYSNQKDTFGDHYDKVMNNRKWVKPVEDLKSMKYIRFITEHGKKWQVGPTEEYYPEDEWHISGLNQNINVLYRWGYWLEYFKIGCSEDHLIHEKGYEYKDMFNPGIMNELFKKSLILLGDLRNLEYFKDNLDKLNL